MVRRAALLVALLLVGSSCGGDDDKEAKGSDTTTSSGTDTDSSSSPSAAPDSSSTATTGGSTSSSGTGPSRTTRTTTRTTTGPGGSAATTATTGSPATTGGTQATVPVPGNPVALADVKVKVTEVAKLDQPLALTQRPGDSTIFVAEKTGRVKALRDGAVAGGNVLDLSKGVSSDGERGLLGIAFSPDGTRFYASFTDTAGDSRLWEYTFANGVADPGTKRELLFVDQPFPNHNGGQILFGPDGLLYYWLGDGGSANDPMRNGQNLGVLLGKLLRINPTPSSGLPYTIPSDNPFVGRSGARGEIYAYGLRNPWRNSFDRQTGDLWIGDVGQSAREEINFRAAGSAKGTNFGWAAREGKAQGPWPVPTPVNPVDPVYDYPTSDGCAVTGGYVYRGTKIPGLTGIYLFGDFCNGQLQALRMAGDQVAERRDLGVKVGNLGSFGEDSNSNGDLYAFSLSGSMYRIDPA